MRRSGRIRPRDDRDVAEGPQRLRITTSLNVLLCNNRLLFGYIHVYGGNTTDSGQPMK